MEASWSPDSSRRSLFPPASAAMLAGGGLAAQQTAQAQQPTAEPVGLKPKIPKPWPPDAETLRKDQLKAEALPLFREPRSDRES